MQATGSNETQKIIDSLSRAVPALTAVYQFGSEAKGLAGPQSDLDLAVLGARPIPPELRFDLEQELAGLLHRNVDLIDLRAASTVLRIQVISEGRCLFSADDPQRETFEAFDLLQNAGLIDAYLATSLKRMLGFRNIAIHEYTKLNLVVVKGILTNRLNDLLTFTHILLKQSV